VAIWEQLDDIGANAFPIAFGNFRRAYMLTERTDLRITTDNVTEPGKVKFYIRRREGGCVMNNNALRWLRTTA
jgi:HK97 family phage major capsid protein